MRTNTKREMALTEGPIAGNLLRFTVPFLFAILLQNLYGIVDTLIIGNFGSTAGLSAVSSGAQLLAVFTYFAIGLSSGGTVLVGQCIGAKDEKRAAKIVGNVIIDFAVVGLILTLAAFVFSPQLLGLLNVPEEAMEQAVAYMKICSCGIPLIIGYNIVCALLRAMGDSKSPLIFVGVACLVNICGDYLLTGRLGMGAMGVAIATVCAQGISFIYSLIFIAKRGMAFPFSLKDIKFHREITVSILKVGIPIGIQSILVNISFMFITAIINSMGLTASAAMGIGDKIVEFAFIPQNAFTSSVSVIVAQNFGAKQYDRAKKSVRYAIVVCLSIGLVFLAICQFMPWLFPSIFTDDAAVIELAGQYMRAYSIDAVLTSITFCLAGMLNGCGKTTYNMAQNLITTFLVRVPLTWILSKLPNANLFIIGCASPASSLVSVIMLALYIKSGRWKKQQD